MINDNEKNEIMENEEINREETAPADAASSDTAAPSANAAAMSESIPHAVTVEAAASSEDDEAQINAEIEAPITAPEEKKETYAFRWSYYDQYVHDNKEPTEPVGKKKKRGITKHLSIYIAVMLVAFSFAFAVLALSLSFDDMSEWFADDPSAPLTVTEIVDKGMPSSVSIYSLKSTNSYSAGSGFVISDYGYVVTNYHVVENALNISAVDSDGHQYSATMIGYNETDDIAVLYLENCRLPAVTLGDSDALELGETVVAIGTPGGEECAFSVSNGIISGLNRSVVGKQLGMIQTNAPLNPGNSGGPLFDSHGNLVGIVTMKYTFTGIKDGDQSVPYEGMSFALPINGVKSQIETFIKNDLAAPKIGITAVPVEAGRDYFYYADDGAIYACARDNDGTLYFMNSNGASWDITDEMLADERNMLLNPDYTGILVVSVAEGLGADGKLLRGDIITEANGVTVKTVADFSGVCKTLGVGDTIRVTFYRDGEKMDETITLMTKLDMLNAVN